MRILNELGKTTFPTDRDLKNYFNILQKMKYFERTRFVHCACQEFYTFNNPDSGR